LRAAQIEDVMPAEQIERFFLFNAMLKRVTFYSGYHNQIFISLCSR